MPSGSLRVLAVLLLASGGGSRKRSLRGHARRLRGNSTRAGLQVNVATLDKPRTCTATDIGLGLGMLAAAAEAPVPEKRVSIQGCSRLDISMTPIGAEGAAALAQALQGSSARRTLTHVNLTWANIGAGSAVLFKALSEAPMLSSLDLSGNWLGDELASRVGRLMRRSPQLRVLRLRWNSFGDAGARLIAQGLPFWRGFGGAAHSRTRTHEEPARQGARAWARREQRGGYARPGL